MEVLLIEDDAMLGAAIVEGLRPRFRIDWRRTIADARAAIAAGGFDLAILDLALPDGSGLDLLKRLRQQNEPLPVLILSARDGLGDRVAGLKAGADDYLVKPFDLDELAARCEAILRRSKGRSASRIVYADLVYEPAARTVSKGGAPVVLSARELAIFDILMSNIGRVISKSQIEEHLYSRQEGVESNAVEVHISHLRRKIGPDLIRTIRGLGYMVPRAP